MNELVKKYNPQEPLAITLTMEQWGTVQHWLDYGACYHHAKMTECLGGNIKDKKMAGEMAAGHERAMRQAESLAKIIEVATHEENETL